MDARDTICRCCGVGVIFLHDREVRLDLTFVFDASFSFGVCLATALVGTSFTTAGTCFFACEGRRMRCASAVGLMQSR